MKRLLDSQGRLFGRWNPFDLLAASGLLFAMILGLWAGTQWLRRSMGPLPVKTFQGVLSAPGPLPTKSFAAGDVILDASSKPIGEIIEIWQTQEIIPDLSETTTATTYSWFRVSLTVPHRGSTLRIDNGLTTRGSPFLLRTDRGSLKTAFHGVLPFPLILADAYVQCSEISPELFAVIREGDTQFDSNGMVVARIVRIESQGIPPPPEFSMQSEEVPPLLTEIPSPREISLTLRIAIDKTPRGYFYQGEPLKLGREFSFDTPNYSLRGQLIRVTTPEGGPLIPPFKATTVTSQIAPYEFRSVRVMVRFEVTPEVLRLIRPGEKEYSRTGQVLARLDQILTSSPNVASNSQGNSILYVLDRDTLRRAYVGVSGQTHLVTAEMHLTCQVQGEKIFYAGHLLRVGSVIPFRTSRYQFSGVVLELLSDEASFEIRKPRYAWFEVMLLSKPIIPELASVIKAGATSHSDLDGQEATILEVLGTQPVRNPDHPEEPLEKISLKLRMYCLSEGELTYFRGESVKVGQALTLYFPRYDLTGFILSFNEIKE